MSFCVPRRDVHSAQSIAGKARTSATSLAVAAAAAATEPADCLPIDDEAVAAAAVAEPDDCLPIANAVDDVRGVAVAARGFHSDASKLSRTAAPFDTGRSPTASPSLTSTSLLSVSRAAADCALRTSRARACMSRRECVRERE